MSSITRRTLIVQLTVHKLFQDTSEIAFKAEVSIFT